MPIRRHTHVQDFAPLLADICRQWAFVAVCLGVALLMSAGCKRDAAADALETDANGYVCLHCGAKFYTDTATTLGPICPKCKDQTLRDVVGYVCAKDHHVTIRSRREDPNGPPKCDLCGAPVQDAMIKPHAKDLIAWGAVKVSP